MALIIDEVTAEAAPPPPQAAEAMEIEMGPLDPLPILALWRRETERRERLWVD